MPSSSNGQVVELSKGRANSCPATIKLAVQASYSPADLLRLTLCEGSQHGSNLLHKLCLSRAQDLSTNRFAHDTLEQPPLLTTGTLAEHTARQAVDQNCVLL